jgi:hypothetical protein
MTDSNHTISPLRQRMIDDMTLRKLAPKTQAGHIRAVRKLTRFLGLRPRPRTCAATSFTWSPTGFPTSRSTPRSAACASTSK